MRIMDSNTQQEARVGLQLSYWQQAHLVQLIIGPHSSRRQQPAVATTTAHGNGACARGQIFFFSIMASVQGARHDQLAAGRTSCSSSCPAHPYPQKPVARRFSYGWKQVLPHSAVGDSRGTHLRLRPLALDRRSQPNMRDSRHSMSSRA